MGDVGVQHKFFRQRQALEFLKRACSEIATENYRNVDGLIGSIIAEGKATLNELRTIYTLEDAFLLWETIAIPRYNQWLANEQVKRRGKS